MDNPVIERIWQRLHKKDKNYIAFFCGETGSGKSEGSISLSLAVDPEFTIEHCVFSIEDLLNLLNCDTPDRGEFVVVEELGVNADRQKFFSIQNKAFAYVTETFRHLNLGLVLNAPGLNLIDSRVYKLGHQYFETCGIDYKRKICTCKVFDLQYNPFMDKVYAKYPRFRINRETVVIERMEFEKPPYAIIREYKKKKLEFTRNLNRSLELEIANSKIDKSAKPKDLSSIVEEILRHPEGIVSSWRGRACVSHSLIMAQFHLGEPSARAAKKLIEFKLNQKRDEKVNNV